MGHEHGEFWLDLARRAWFLLMAIIVARVMYKRTVLGTITLYGQTIERHKNPAMFWSIMVSCGVAVVLLLLAGVF